MWEHSNITFELYFHDIAVNHFRILLLLQNHFKGHGGMHDNSILSSKYSRSISRSYKSLA